eukprot:scaffold1782_cov160-Skeletonema_marinoi.AAC.2
MKKGHSVEFVALLDVFGYDLEEFVFSGYLLECGPFLTVDQVEDDCHVVHEADWQEGSDSLRLAVTREAKSKAKCTHLCSFGIDCGSILEAQALELGGSRSNLYPPNLPINPPISA